MITAVPAFAEFAVPFLKWAKTNLAEATVVLHRVNIDRLKPFFRGKLIDDLRLAEGYVSLPGTRNVSSQRIEATAKLQACVEAARRAQQLQEEQEAEDLKPKEDEWGVPIVEVEESSPQNPLQSEEIENLPF